MTLEQRLVELAEAIAGDIVSLQSSQHYEPMLASTDGNSGPDFMMTSSGDLIMG